MVYNVHRIPFMNLFTSLWWQHEPYYEQWITTVVTLDFIHIIFKLRTRTTRMPAFWGYPPPPHDYPYYWVIMDPKSKEDKVKFTNWKNSPKLQIFEFCNKHYRQHIFWSCLIRCANMKWIRWVLLKIQSRHDSVHRRTDGETERRRDGETEKVKPVYPPFNFVEAGGIIKDDLQECFRLSKLVLLAILDVMEEYSGGMFYPCSFCSWIFLYITTQVFELQFLLKLYFLSNNSCYTM